MADYSVAEFRMRADECLREARRSESAVRQAVWLRIANAWAGLVEDAERRSQAGAHPVIVRDCAPEFVAALGRSARFRAPLRSARTSAQLLEAALL